MRQRKVVVAVSVTVVAVVVMVERRRVVLMRSGRQSAERERLDGRWLIARRRAASDCDGGCSGRLRCGWWSGTGLGRAGTSQLIGQQADSQLEIV
jgi:hypothetical protein